MGALTQGLADASSRVARSDLAERLADMPCRSSASLPARIQCTRLFYRLELRTRPFFAWPAESARSCLLLLWQWQWLWLWFAAGVVQLLTKRGVVLEPSKLEPR